MWILITIWILCSLISYIGTAIEAHSECKRYGGITKREVIEYGFLCLLYTLPVACFVGACLSVPVIWKWLCKKDWMNEKVTCKW